MARIDIHEPMQRNGNNSFRFHAFRYPVDRLGKPTKASPPQLELSFIGELGTRLELEPGRQKISFFGKAPRYVSSVRYDFERQGNGAFHLVAAHSYLRGQGLTIKTTAAGSTISRYGTDGKNTDTSVSGAGWSLAPR